MSENLSKKLKIVMHLGAHKTATTHLQHSLYANSALLEHSKVQFRGPRDLRSPKKSLRSQFDLGTIPKLKTKVETDRDLIRLTRGANRLVLSEENFLGPMWRIKRGKQVSPLYPYADSRLEKLIPSFGGRPLFLFLAIRNPADFMTSAYSQSLGSGNIEPFSDFAKGVKFESVRWSNVVRRLSLLPEVTKIYVWRYENYPENFTRIMRKLLGWKLGRQVEPIRRRVHPGMSVKAVQHVLEHSSKNDYQAQLRELAVTSRTEMPITLANPRYSPWNEKEIETAASAYKSDLAEIAKMEKVLMIH